MSLVLYGVWALCLWVGLSLVYILCTVPTDLRFYLELSQKLQDAWAAVEEDDSIFQTTEDKPLEVRKGRNKFACKLAARVIGRVGMLKPTHANALVYQKELLHEMKSLNVRYSDRVRVLPLAVVACMERPAETQRVEEVIDLLIATGASL